jgi:hypothetical protein
MARKRRVSQGDLLIDVTERTGTWPVVKEDAILAKNAHPSQIAIATGVSGVESLANPPSANSA